jgi:polyhydroxyalkanoate synthesis regulator phasin
MSRYSDNAPIGHTCPKIDSVISQIHALYMSSEEMTKQEYAEFEKLMEEIRSANSTLREWGNEENKKAEEFEKDLDYEKSRVANLESEVEDLKKEVESLEKELLEHQDM